MTEKPSIKSPYYPYYKTQESYIDLSELADLPRKICDYLIDAPKGDYEPIDDNNYPRTRFWKLLFYDDAKPLSNPLPTIQQKMELVFNPEKPTDAPSEKGYRLIPQIKVPQSQTKAQTRIQFHIGRTVPRRDNFKVAVSIVFDIFCNYTQELLKEEIYNRTIAIEQCIYAMFDGLNMAGIGTFMCNKGLHPDCDSIPFDDGVENVGREVTIALELATTAPNKSEEYNEIPFGDGTFMA